MITLRKCTFIFFLFIFYATTQASALIFNGEFHFLSMKNGLADNIIEAIHRDRDGFMWFGTSTGLSRYDGKYVKNFRSPQEGFAVYSIQETSKGKLWILSNGSAYCFDRYTETFIPVLIPSPAIHSKISEIQILNDSTLLVMTNKGVFQLAVFEIFDEKFKLSSLTLNITNKFTIPDLEGCYFVKFSISEDKRKLYLLTYDARLLIFDIGLGKLLYKSKLLSAPNLFVTSILCKGDYLWITSVVGGVIRFHTVTHQFEQFVYHQNPKLSRLSHTDAYSITALDDNSYIATTWNGFTLFSPDEHNPSRMISKVYSSTAFLPYQNLETRMISSFYDSNGVLWVGTRGGGVFYIDLKEQFYKRFSYHQHNEISAQVSDADNYIWMATFHGGIMRSDTPFMSTKSTSLTFTTVPNLKKVPSLCGTKDIEKNLWFGNYEGELTCYEWKTKTFRSYILMVNGKQIRQPIRSILADSQQHYWIGTDKGLYLFSPVSGLCRKIKLDPSAKVNFSIKAIAEDKYHCLWLATDKGIIRLQEYKTNNVIVSKGYEKKAGIKVRSANTLLTTSDGYTYAGYMDGFAVISQEENKITDFYTVNDGLCNDNINCILQDIEGQIWLGNISGISRYSRHQKLFYNYFISGSNRSAMMLDSTLFWGNNRSLTYFNPKKITNVPVNNRVFFVELEVSNKRVGISEEVNGQVILNRHIAYTEHIELKNANRDFSLHFNNLTYSNRIQKYIYRLYPYQQEWIITENGSISYTNLPVGDYRFEVKAIYPDHEESQIAVLEVTILPHWSQTMLFRLLIILCVLALVGYLLTRMNKRQIRIRKVMELKHELQVATIERDKEKTLREERGAFFTNTAHELRTPLTLILSPLQGLLKSVPPTEDIYSSLSIMYRNCSSLSKLVDYLLYMQKIEAGMVKLHLSEWDIVKVVQKQKDYFQQMAFIRECELIVRIEVDSLNLWIDVDKIESAIGNLLTNAFKYTPRDGQVELALSRREIDSTTFCMISVTDNGIGIAEDLREHLFEPFVAGNHTEQFSTAVGIGLYIVKHTIDLHHGRVMLDTKEGEGTCITLCIPEGNKHFEKDNYTQGPSKLQDLLAEPTVWTVPLNTKEITTPSDVFERPTILIVEDNLDMREYVSSLFHHDYHVIEAVNGVEGVELAQQKHPHLIISDVMMPVMDGFQCCTAIRNNPETSHIPIILLTAKAEDMDKLHGIKLGVDDYMMKPFNPQILCEKVRSLLIQREQLKRLYTQSLMLKPVAEEEKDNLFIRKVIQVVEENLINKDFSVRALADRLNMSQPTLYRKIRQHTDLSVIEVIRGVRMTKAASLLMEHQYSTQEVSEMVGFESVNAFRKHFVAQFGVLPSKYSGEQKVK